ncbi:MAG: hypothetical protein ACPHEU_09665, partial [Acidimicrobiales bacterium]
ASLALLSDELSAVSEADELSADDELSSSLPPQAVANIVKAKKAINNLNNLDLCIQEPSHFQFG